MEAVGFLIIIFVILLGFSFYAEKYLDKHLRKRKLKVIHGNKIKRQLIQDSYLRRLAIELNEEYKKFDSGLDNYLSILAKKQEIDNYINTRKGENNGQAYRIVGESFRGI